VAPPRELDETYVTSLILADSLHYMKTRRHPQNRKVRNVSHCSQRRTETRPQVTRGAIMSHVKFGRVVLPARRYASEVFTVISCLSVRPFVRSSQAGIVSKRLNVGSQKQRYTVAQGLWFYGAKDFYEIPMGSPPKGAPNAGRVGKNCVFDRLRSLRCFTAEIIVSIRHGGQRP